MCSIVIVGAGFSGVVTAIQILSHCKQPGLHVTLLNRSGRIARGVAFGTTSAHHLLNVPSGNMSASAEYPDDFLSYCKRLDAGATAADFMPRSWYGDYLESLLEKYEIAHPGAPTFTRVVGHVCAIHLMPDGRSANVALSDGRSFAADRIVMAFGHFPPNNPPVGDCSFYASRRYIRDPWQNGALDTIAGSEPVLLLGTGLTAIDVALSLNAAHAHPLHAISRRGLLPQPHRVRSDTISHLLHPLHPPLPRLPADFGNTARNYLHTIRQLVRETSRPDDDWRDVVASLRPWTDVLWTRLPPAERSQFLRHLQGYWEVHRHRAAPAAHAKFTALRENGALKISAGRVLGYRDEADGAVVSWQPRGAKSAITLTFSTVINCTGPGADLHQVADPLILQLLDAGLLCRDPLGVGIEVSSEYALLDVKGNPSAVLHYIGPLLKAKYWEATAVPELRVHAQRLADILLSSLNQAAADDALSRHS